MEQIHAEIAPLIQKKIKADEFFNNSFKSEKEKKDGNNAGYSYVYSYDLPFTNSATEGFTEEDKILQFKGEKLTIDDCSPDKIF